MAEVCTTARPPKTAIAWATRDSLFCEIPCRDGAPYIVRYKLTVEGLQAALNILLDAPEATARPATVASHTAIRRPKVEFNDAERQGVRDIMKKLGVI